MVAGAGLEPRDLRVMSPTSYLTAPPRITFSSLTHFGGLVNRFSAFRRARFNYICLRMTGTACFCRQAQLGYLSCVYCRCLFGSPPEELRRTNADLPRGQAQLVFVVCLLPLFVLGYTRRIAYKGRPSSAPFGGTFPHGEGILL